MNEENSNDSGRCKLTQTVEKKKYICLRFDGVYPSKTVENSKAIANSLRSRDELAHKRTSILAYHGKKYKTSKDLQTGLSTYGCCEKSVYFL